MIAVDFSDARPAPAELAQAGVVRAFVYVGRSRPTAQECAAYRAAGVGMAWIFESTTTRAFDGYAAGAQDGAYTLSRLDLALPGDPISWTCDTPNITGHEDAVTGYAEGFAVGLGRTPDLGYGPQAAMRAAGTNVLAWWGVEVWTGGGYGIPPGQGSTSTNDPDHLAKNVEVWRGIGAAMVQAFGPGPVPGTDLNVVLDPAAIGVGPELEEDTLYVLRCAETQQIATVSEFRVAAYPIPEGTSLAGAVIIDCTKAELDAEIAARQQLVTDLAGNGGGGAPVPVNPAVKAGITQASDGLASAAAALG